MRNQISSLIALVLLVPLLFFGCGSGDDGAPGAAGTNAPTTGTIAGTVTDAVKGDALAGVTVTAYSDNTAKNVIATTTTDALGNYSMTVPIGGAIVTMSKQYYNPPGAMFVGIGGGVSTQLNATMSENATGAPSISIAAQAGDDFGYGSTITVAASVNYFGLTDPNDNVSSLTFTWSNATSPKFTKDGKEYGKVVGSGNSAQLTFPTMAVAFSPRPAATQPGADVSGYTIPNQFGVIPIFPDTRGGVAVKLVVKDPRGQSFSPPNLTLNAASIVPGTRSVPLGARIYLNGGDNASYNWTGTAPGGGVVAFDNNTIRTPSFPASASGAYTVSVNGKSMIITAGTYQGLFTNGTITGDLLKDGTATDIGNSNCFCHITSFGSGLTQATTWVKTRHAKIFAQNVTTNADPPGESRTCIVCHSVGYDEGVPSAGGFTAKMYAFDNLFFPYGVYFGNIPNFWTSLFDNAVRAPMAALANVQCENCHGPNGAGHTQTATTGLYGSPRISFSAEVCAQCHGRTSHNFYSQWATLGPGNTRYPLGRGHSNVELAQDEGIPGAGPNSCGRCHSAQGFLVYLDQLATGNIGYLNNLQVVNPVSFAALGKDNVAPITCTACHDSHQVTYLTNPDGTPKINPETGRQETNNQLRLYNDSPLLPSGFKVTGFGKGALCVACHNSRRASTKDNTVTFLHEDTDHTPVTNWESTNTPHESAQSDSFVGRNAYFMGTSLPMLSRHAAIEDTCVTCHMARNPNVRSETVEFGNVIRTAKSHTFRIGNEKGFTIFCGNCHGVDAVNGEAIQAATEVNLAALASAMGSSMLTVLNAKGDSLVNTGADNVAGNTITAAAYAPSDTGGQNFKLFYPAKPAGVTVSLANLKNTADSSVIFPLGTSNMYKAAWNYSLVVCDGSGGLHNPSFTLAVLNNTREADLKAGAN